MQNIPDWSIDMILYDLPYWVSNCSWDIVIPFEPMWEQYNRIIKPNWVIVLFWGEPFSSFLRMSNIRNYRYDWIWDKVLHSNPLIAKKQPLSAHENICVFYSKQPIYNPQMGIWKEIKRWNESKWYSETKWDTQIFRWKDSWKDRYPKKIITFSNANKNWVVHPTQKPVTLLEYLIRSNTNEWDLVLDNCMGSWSTWVAAKNLNRDFIWIELEEKYFNIAKERIWI